MRYEFRATICALVLVSLSACGGGGGSNGEQSPSNTNGSPLPPTISSFSSAQSVITEGDATELSAVFQNGTGHIDNGIGTIFPGSPVSVSPSNTTVYRLSVANTAGVTATQDVRVRVVPPPVISAFDVQAELITSGDTALLTAKFSEGTASIDGGVGEVISGTSVEISPVEDTTYTLSVLNEAGTVVSASVSISVLPMPEILAFDVKDPQVVYGDSTNLIASFTGGTGSVDNAIGPIVSDIPIVIRPSEITTYRLTVENELGVNVTSQLSVEVVDPPPPFISSFSTLDEIISSGEMTALTAVFSGGFGVINNGVSAVQSGVPVEIRPMGPTNYTLTVTNAVGVSDTRQIFIEVLEPPAIASFTVGQSPLTDGDTTTLLPIFNNGEGVIDHGVGSVVSGTSISISPEVDTSYTLSVSNLAETTVQETLSVDVVPPPSITSFEATDASIQYGETTTLTAGFTSGSGSVDNGIGSISSGIPVDVSPKENTRYTLSVENEAGTEVTAYVDIEVIAGYFELLAARLAVGRSHGTAVLLSNGQVLLPGGWDPDQIAADELTDSAELYDHATQSFVLTGSLSSPRSLHGSAPLPDGRALVLGGSNRDAATDVAEIYDPVTGLFTVTDSMSIGRNYPVLASLHDGRIVVAGGGSTQIEIYDPDTELFSNVGVLENAQSFNTATVLQDGRVLFAGGAQDFPAEIFDPSDNSVVPTGKLNISRTSHTATLLEDGRVLLTGGHNGDSLASAEIYDPETGLFELVGFMSTERASHTATLLPNGKVLIAAGDSLNNHIVNSAELFDPVTEAFSPTGHLSVQRYSHTATLLNDGTVLIAGGLGQGGSLKSQLTAEIYHPQSKP